MQTSKPKINYDALTFITPEGIISYPALFEKKMYMNKAESAAYSCELIIPKNADLSKGNAAVEYAGEILWGDKEEWPEGVVKPFLDGDQINKKAEREGKSVRPEIAGKWVIRAKSKTNKVLVIDGKTEPITDPALVYGGCFGKMKVNAKAVDFGGTPRIIFYLQVVQKTKDGQSFGNRATAEGFDVVEDGSDTESNYEEGSEDTAALGF